MEKPPLFPDSTLHVYPEILGKNKEVPTVVNSFQGHSNIGVYASGQSQVNIGTLNQTIIQRIAPRKKVIRLTPFSTQNFVGRTGEMNEIHRHFSALTHSDANPLTRMLIITGSAGMGKSELAKKFAETYIKEYPNVVHFNSETKESLETRFHDLAVELELSKEDQNRPPKTKSNVDISALLPKIYKLLLSEGYGRSLFIFDNAVALESTHTKFGLKDYLPQSGYLQMPFFLMTSRNPNFWENQSLSIKIFSLSLLPKEETQKFLLRMSQLDEELAPDVQEMIEKISSIIGGYPLGLKLTSEIQATGRRTSVSANERTKQRLKVLLKILENVNQRLDSQNIEGEDRQFEMLRALFEAKVETILKDNEDAVRLLGIISLLNADSIYTDYCCGIFYRIPFPITPFECKGMNKNDEFKAAIQKLQDHNIIDVEQSSLWWESKIKIHRQLQKLTKMRLASLRDISVLEEVALWCESAKNFKRYRLDYFSNILEDMFDIFEPSQMPSGYLAPMLELYFRFIHSFSSSDELTEEDKVEKFGTFEQKLRSKIEGGNVMEKVKMLLGRHAHVDQTDLYNIVELYKTLQKEKQSKVIRMMEKSFPKLKAVAEEIKPDQEIWKVHFCIKCCDFLPKKRREYMSRQLLHRVAEVVHVFHQNDVITNSVLRAVSECWKLLESSDADEVDAACVVRILINLEPQSWVYIVRQFWLGIQNLLKEPKIRQEFLKQVWLEWICNILAHLTENNGAELACQNWNSYFQPILEIFNRILLSHAKEAERMLRSKRFLEILAHHTQIILSHKAGFFDFWNKAVDLPGKILLFWSELEKISNSVTHFIESMLSDWLEDSGRIFWLHDLQDEGNVKGIQMRMKIKCNLEDPKSHFSPIMERCLKWILITSQVTTSDYFQKQCQTLTDTHFQLTLLKSEFSHRIDYVKQQEFGNEAIEILKIMSFFSPRNIYSKLPEIFKTFLSGQEALKVLQSQSIIKYHDNEMSFDCIMLDPIFFEILWNHMEKKERMSLVDKVSDFFLENIDAKLSLSEPVLKKAKLWFEFLDVGGRILWLRLLLCNCLSKNQIVGELYNSMYSKIIMAGTKDPAYAYALVCLFLSNEADDNIGKRIIVSERAVLQGLDALFEDDQYCQANWHIHTVLTILPMLESNGANETFNKLVSWAKSFATEFIGEIFFDQKKKKLKCKWKIAESNNIRLTTHQFADLVNNSSRKSCWILKFVLAKYNFHGTAGLLKFWTDFKEPMKEMEDSCGLCIFSEFFIENFNLLQAYELNDEVGRLFDFIRDSILSDVFKFYSYPYDIVDYKRFLESLEDYAQNKFLDGIDGDSDRKSLSFTYPKEPDLHHGIVFYRKFVAYSNSGTQSTLRIHLEESTQDWLQAIANGYKTEEIAVVVDAANWFLQKSASALYNFTTEVC